MKLYLVRHGQTDWNLAGRIQGKTDTELNEEGLRQACLVAKALADKSVGVVYTSTLKRATATALMIAEAKGVEVYGAKGLEEVSFGHWEGLSWAEIEKQYPKEYASWRVNPVENQPPGGESQMAVIRRSVSVIQTLLDEERRDMAIVSHGATIAAMLSYFLKDNPEEIEFPVGNASITTLEYNRISQDLHILSANDMTHLQEVE